MIAKFLADLEKSELLTAEQLAEAKQAGTKTGDPKALARALVRQGRLSLWQANQVLSGRTALRMGKYRLIELLGKGGMGNVFLGQHVTMNRRVALKVLGKELVGNPEARERFLAEARAVAALDHPNIVRAYSVDEEGDRYYLVMEYVDGRDLQRIVEEDGPLQYAVAADAIRQAADGLAHAHSKGMIHCDIKPSNLLVNSQGVVKILDLGLARLGGHKQTSGSGGQQFLGTVDYMAPEQGLGSASFDHRADIYSLGCTLYFLLTGRPPFPEGTLAERIVKHQTQLPASILECRPDAPRDLVKICRKMMAKHPQERFQTAAEISTLLASWKPERKIRVAKPLEEPAPEPAAEPPAEVATEPEAEPAASGSWSHGKRARADHRRIFILGGIGLFTLVVAGLGSIPFLTSKPSKPAHTAPKHATESPAPSPAAKPVEPVAGDTGIWGGLDQARQQRAEEEEKAAKARAEKAAQDKAAKEKAAKAAKDKAAKDKATGAAPAKPGDSKTQAAKPGAVKPAAKKPDQAKPDAKKPPTAKPDAKNAAPATDAKKSDQNPPAAKP